MADQTIRTVKPNLIKIKGNSGQHTAYIWHIQKKNLSKLWKSLKMVLRFLRATYEREQIKKLTISLQVISEYSLMVQ